MSRLRARSALLLSLLLPACGERTELSFDGTPQGTGATRGTGGGNTGGATGEGGSGGAGGVATGGYPGYGGGPYPGGGYPGYGGYPTGGYPGYGGYPYPVGGFAGYGASGGYGGYPYPAGGYPGYGGYPYPVGGFAGYGASGGYGGYPYPTGGYAGYGAVGGSCWNCPNALSPDGYYLSACCTATGVCGLVTESIAPIVPGLPYCAELFRYGVPNPVCPPELSTDGRLLSGCCAADGFCGVELDAFALGCQRISSNPSPYCGP